MKKFYEKTISSKEIFSGKVFSVTTDEAQLENGKIAVREVVHHNGGAGVLALRDDGHIVMVRQYRYGASQELLEIPAGKVEVNEPPLETARRELREEAGLLANKLEPFGAVLPTGAYCTETIHLFLATGLQPVEQALDEDEFLSVFWMDLNEVVQLILKGEITDSKTVSAVLRLHILQNNGAIIL